MSKDIFIYPSISDQLSMDNVISRLAWYMYPYLDKISSIKIAAIDKSFITNVKLAPYLDPKIERRIIEIKKKISFHTEDGLKHLICEADPKQDVILITDEKAKEKLPSDLKSLFAVFTKYGGCYRVDPERTRQEGSFYLWCGLNKFSNAQAMLEEEKNRFDQMLDEVGRYRKAYVFGTGPSFSDFVEKHDFDDGICIVANSIVKNDDALRKLRPQIICAADPIYHAGCSSYAGAFRASLIEALERTGAWFLCPMRDAAIYRSFLPEHLLKRTISIPFDGEQPIPTNLSDRFYINPFPNVLTLMLLPIASTLAEQIHVVGCDGRPLLDDSFFWSHDKKVQFNDQMEDIQAAHPGFFAIDYNDYYLDHCHDLERVLCSLEDAGRRIVNLTPSLIPALRSRQVDKGPSRHSDNLSVFVMLDPDAKDDWGHFLAYDKRVLAATRENGLRTVLMCRKELAQEFCPPDTDAFIPCFSVNSWTIGNKSPALREHVLKFGTELKEGLCKVEQIFSQGGICLFFYVGSIEAAELLEHLLIDHPRITAVINLFWSYNFDQNDPTYRTRWLPTLRRLKKHPQICLMHSTSQIATEFQRDWSIPFEILEHPSVTFSDEEARDLSNTDIEFLNADHHGRLRVLFPGGARQEKGFLLSIEAADALRESKSFQPILRSRVDAVSGSLLHKAYDALDKAGIEIVDQHLSDAGFVSMISTADIVVLPYHRDAFRRRTSGILVDAMLLGKPVVVLKDTWLADVVIEEQIGVCVPPTSAGLISGIQNITNSREEFIRNISDARKRYLSKNSWSALIQHVLSAAKDTERLARNTEAGEPSLERPQLLLSFCAARILLDPVGMTEKIAADAALAGRIAAALEEGGPAADHYRKVLAWAGDRANRTAA